MIEGNPTLFEYFISQSEREEFADSIKRISRWARRFKDRWQILAILCGSIGVPFLYMGWIARGNLALIWYVGLAIELIAIVLWYAPYLIWRRLFEGPIYRDWPKILKSDDAKAMIAFLQLCADGVIKVETHLGERIDPSHFRTVVAILLLSDEVIDRMLVRSKVGFRTYRAQLHVIKEEVGRVVPSPSDAGKTFASDGPVSLEPIQSGVDPVATGNVSSSQSEAIQLIVETGAAHTVTSDQSESAQQQGNATLAVPVEIPNTEAPSPIASAHIESANSRRSDSGTRLRDDSIKLVAAALDKANISKRDVKSHHIAERWDESVGPQPDVGSVRALMKGKQAGAPSRAKAFGPTNPN